MNPQDPLANLHDIHLPPAVSDWPPAPGWWFLAVITLTLVATLLIRWLTHKRRNRYRREALADLKKTWAFYQQDQNPAHLVENINALLRRTAMTAYPNEPVAALLGQQWLDFLSRRCSDTPFNTDIGNSLISAQYQPNPKVDTQNLLRLTQRWIKNHQPAHKIKHHYQNSKQPEASNA